MISVDDGRIVQDLLRTNKIKALMFQCGILNLALHKYRKCVNGYLVLFVYFKY